MSKSNCQFEMDARFKKKKKIGLFFRKAIMYIGRLPFVFLFKSTVPKVSLESTLWRNSMAYIVDLGLKKKKLTSTEDWFKTLEESKEW